MHVENLDNENNDTVFTIFLHIISPCELLVLYVTVL